MYHYRLLLVEFVAADPIADVVAWLPDDVAALRLPRRINLGGGVAPGEEGLLLHDRGSWVRHNEANHGFAGDNTHSAAHSLPNSSAHTAANISARSSASTSRSSARSSASTSHDAGTGTSRPSRPLQLRSGRVNDVGS